MPFDLEPSARKSPLAERAEAAMHGELAKQLGDYRARHEPKPIARPRFVPLTPELFRLAAAFERDPLTSEMMARPEMEPVFVNAWGVAMIAGGLVLAAGGLVPMWHGRAEAWLLVSREARPRDIVRALDFARDRLDLRQRDPAFRRVEVWCRSTAPYREDFMRALGFAYEGTARRYDPAGRDHCLYARLAEGAS